MPRPPQLRHVANAWTLEGHPSPNTEWSLETKFRAAKAAAFDTFNCVATPRHRALGDKYGLTLLGLVCFSRQEELAALVKAQKDAGVVHLNIQLGDHDTPVKEAVRLAVAAMKLAAKHGLIASIEVHRDTATETPEKTYAIADGYERITGELLPLTWDFSHLAVVKHLTPDSYLARLLVRPDLIQRAQQFHFRPFNGHHCQVPVTDRRGRLTREVNQWFPFLRAVIALWQAAPRNRSRELFATPEIGPQRASGGGYGLDCFPGSWGDACRLRQEIDRHWKQSAAVPAPEPQKW